MADSNNFTSIVTKDSAFVERENIPDDLYVDIERSKTAPFENTKLGMTETQLRTRSVSKEDQQIIFDSVERHNGWFVRDEKGRIKIVYPDDDGIGNEYYSSIPHKVVSSDLYNEEFKNNINTCMQGIEQQKINKYPFSVISNPKTKTQLKTSETGSYRKDRDYSTIETIYKHPLAFTIVDIVKDTFTGFRHICKSVIISKFRREEIEAMIQVPEYAPRLYGICRDGEHVRIHMEYIDGTRGDEVAQCLLDRNAWPFCLHLFGQLTIAIQKLGLDCLSHGDIHVQNIIIETENNGSSLRIRLLDYGDASKHASASQYTLSGLMNDMKSIVSSIITIFTGNTFDGYEEDPQNWIKECKERYPQLCAILQGALMAQNEKDISKLISDLTFIIKDETDFQQNLSDLATTLSVKKFEKISISETDAIAIGNHSELPSFSNQIAVTHKRQCSGGLQTAEGET